MATPKSAHNATKQKKQTPRTQNRGVFGRWYSSQTKDQRNLLSVMFMGVVLISLAAVIYIQTLSLPTFENVPNTYATPHSDVPMLLRISSINLALPIESGYIEKGRWYISPTTVTFLTSSSTPGTDGPIIIYGHNKKKILGSLSQVKKGDYISILTERQKIHNYQVVSEEIVSPRDVHILQEDKETLIIYTCAGWADTQRLVVKAKPMK